MLTATGGAQNYAYTYDKYGNILTANGHTYSYGDGNWKDKLTAFDGQVISYDASGNPTSYYNGTRWTFGWQNGKELGTASGGGHTMSYAYDLNGLRTSKVVDGVTHTYLYAGGKLLRETYGGNTLDFFYDQAGQPYALTYNGTTYYYVLNLQGDVMALVDANGNSVATYNYDPYGKVITASGILANINPLRYRGYYYDTETGFYYLQSRYYDPSICRFINADNYTTTGQGLNGYNMYAYCGNDPVDRLDDGGELWYVAIGAAVGAVAGVIGQLISDVVTSAIEGKIGISNWQTYAGAAVGGAAGGIVLATTGNMNAANAVTGTVTTGVGQSLEKLTIKDYDKSWGEIASNAVVDGTVSYGLGKLPGFKGVTAGRNSWSAVYKSGLTKLRNGTASRMSIKVFLKGIGSSAVGGLALDGYYGIKQYAYDRVKARVRTVLS